MAPIITARPTGSLRKLSPTRSLASRTSKAPAMTDVRKLLLVTVCLRQSGRGRVASALDITIRDVPGRQQGSLP